MKHSHVFTGYLKPKKKSCPIPLPLSVKSQASKCHVPNLCKCPTSSTITDVPSNQNLSSVFKLFQVNLKFKMSSSSHHIIKMSIQRQQQSVEPKSRKCTSIYNDPAVLEVLHFPTHCEYFKGRQQACLGTSSSAPQPSA